MNEEVDHDMPDWLAELIYSRARSVILRVLQGIFLSFIAALLSYNQIHSDYSEWVIGLVVLILGSLNRFRWLASAIVAWLVFLYLFTPDIAARVSTFIRAAG